jgi:hypothetical protein
VTNGSNLVAALENEGVARSFRNEHALLWPLLAQGGHSRKKRYRLSTDSGDVVIEAAFGRASRTAFHGIVRSRRIEKTWGRPFPVFTELNQHVAILGGLPSSRPGLSFRYTQQVLLTGRAR